MNRRSFIKNSAKVTLLPFVLSAFQQCTNRSKNKIFVLIQLVGGNDGLNTLIPLDNYKNIVSARPNIFIPENKILPIKKTNLLGLHPSLSSLQDMFNNDLLCFIQGVGYEHPSYSHFRSTDIWNSGSDFSNVLDTGWLARYLENNFGDYKKERQIDPSLGPLAVKIGDTGTSLFQGRSMDMGIVVNPFTGLLDTKFNLDNTIADIPSRKKVEEIREILLQTSKFQKVVNKALNTNFNHSRLYPEKGSNPLADQLKAVAKLISSGLQTSIYLVDLKGFDTHNDQVDPTNTTKGIHSQLLKNLSEAITSFWDDIIHLDRENDVVGMTFSEFGRRIKSNGSHGTDHGSSQPIICFGSEINAGIIGANPIIPANVTTADNLALQFDYRQLYSSILNDWFKVKDIESQKVLFGEFNSLNLFKKR
jgi:uncharacterized protein (DUF1501 family)